MHAALDSNHCDKIPFNVSHLRTAYRSAKGIIQAFTSQLGSSFKCMDGGLHKFVPLQSINMEWFFFDRKRAACLFFIKKEN
jgi:hypothetical protein